MTAQDRAREIARLVGLDGADAATLVGRASKLAALGLDDLEAAAREHHAAAQRAPSTRLAGATQLLVTVLREDRVIDGLPDDAARKRYEAGLTGFGKVGGASGGLAEWTSEPPRPPAPEPDAEQKAAAAATAARAAREAKIAELYRNPALKDATAKDHGALVKQLHDLHQGEE